MARAYLLGGSLRAKVLGRMSSYQKPAAVSTRNLLFINKTYDYFQRFSTAIRVSAMLATVLHAPHQNGFSLVRGVENVDEIVNGIPHRDVSLDRVVVRSEVAPEARHPGSSPDVQFSVTHLLHVEPPDSGGVVVLSNANDYVLHGSIIATPNAIAANLPAALRPASLGVLGELEHLQVRPRPGNA